VIPLDDDTVALALTTGRYLTPLGHDLAGTGLEPDISLDYEGYKALDPEVARLEEKIRDRQKELLEATDELMQHLRDNDRQLEAAQQALRERADGQPD
jgi:C-terminal processing protease CtpA/Prc